MRLRKRTINKGRNTKMLNRIQFLAIISFFSLILAAIPTASLGHVQPAAPTVPSPAVQFPPLSSQNAIRQFYATGEDPDKSVRVNLSDTGGYILYHGVKIGFLGWYSQYWAAYNMFLVHLVNVTADNFHVAYLYLEEFGGYKWIGFWIYSYASMAGTGNPSRHEWVGWFTGDYWIGYSTQTPSVQVPQLNIRPAFKTINHLYSDGPFLKISAKVGFTTQMTLYPLLAYLNVYDPTRGYWNELWTLGLDASGNFYYVIFYMYANYPQYVLQGYTLNLTDYSIRLGYAWHYSPWWYEQRVGQNNVPLT